MSIKQEMLKGVFWSAVEKYSGILVSLVISAILARLISPEDFGIVAIATVIINFLQMFTSMGIAPAIVQRNDLTQENLNSIFTYSIIGGVLLSLVLFFSSWTIADFYGNHILIQISKVLSINLFFAALNLVPNALMAKNKRFKQIAQRTLLLQLLSGSVAILAAYQGLGVYALLISPIITSMGMFAFNMHFYPCRIDRTFDVTPLKKIFSYSSYQFLFEFINYFSRNLDKLIVGKYMNMSALGYYEKSYRLMMLPLQNVTHVITPVMQPVLSELQNSLQELANKYMKILNLLAYIGISLSVYLFFTSRELILCFFGEQWEGAVPPFQILSLTVAFQILTSTSGSIYQVANATKGLFISGCCGAVAKVSSFLITTLIWGTIEAVAYGFLFATLLDVIQCFLLLFKTLKYPIVNLIKTLYKPLFVGMIIAAALQCWDSCISIDSLFVSLCVKTLITLVLYASLMLTVSDYRHWILSKIKIVNK